MGVGCEMGDERTRAYNHQVKQYLEVLRLQDDEYRNHQVERHEDVVNHARTDFVELPLAGIMDDSQQRQQGHPSKHEQLVTRDVLILEKRLKVGDAHKMVDERVETVAVDRPSNQEPVGSDDSQERCPHHSPAEGHQLESHHQPQEGNEEDDLDEQQAGNAQTQEGKVGEAWRLLVLIGVEDDGAERDEAEHAQRRP